MKTLLLGILMLQTVSLAQVQPTSLVTSTAIEPKRPSADAAVARDYLLNPGDVVDIRFFYNPELNEQQVAIRPDGRVQLQLVGDYEIAGKTPEQAGQEMERIYSHTLKTPSVTVQVRNFAMNRIFVTGEVPKPGLVNLNGPLSILTALGEVGGISTKGNRKTVFLIRRSDSGTAERHQVALYDHGQPTVEATAMLRPFDVILVPEAKAARIDRWVDEYIKQLSPANLVVGFQYLMQNTPAAPVF